MRAHRGRHDLAAMVLVILGGCSDGAPSSLAERAAELPVTSVPPPSFATVAASRQTPEGIRSHVWRDIHWLPPTIDGITMWSNAAESPLVSWLASNLGDDPVCARALAGAGRTVMVDPPGATPKMISVVLGDLDRGAVERCAEGFAPVLGASVHVTDEITQLTSAGDRTYLSWARVGDDVLVAEFADRTWIAAALASPPDALAAHAELMPLLHRVDTASPMWYVTANDYGTPILGVPSLGGILTMTTDRAAPLRIGVELRFEHEADARAAADAVDSAHARVADTLGSDASLRAAISDRMWLSIELTAPVGYDFARLAGALPVLLGVDEAAGSP